MCKLKGTLVRVFIRYIVEVCLKAGNKYKKERYTKSFMLHSNKKSYLSTQ